MSDLVGNPEARFSHVEALMVDYKTAVWPRGPRGPRFDTYL